MPSDRVPRPRSQALSMTHIRLSPYSEPYGATGNIGDNFQRLLGAPSLDRLQTTIREAVQNIADAAKLGVGPEIEIRLRCLTPEQQEVLASRIICGRLQEPRSNELLSAMRSRRKLVVMEICDFGTTGLGGPTRSDRIPSGVKDTDFIDFLRNVGTVRDTAHGGGTYGFGKVALYRASKCRTIVVDTVPHGSGPEGRRLIGCHVGSSFEVPQDGMRRRFTGRHWWGIPDPRDGIVDPVTGEGAKALASELGLPGRDTDRSGTSVMILDFETDGDDLTDVGNRVVESILWNFWPRMMRDTPPDKRFTCRVEVSGSPLKIPAPEDYAPLDLFAKAMRAVRTGTGNDVRPISSKRPKKRLGTLAIETGLRTPRRELVGEASLFPASSSHIALMRPVELVVKYLEGQPLPDERLQWAAVFVASGEDEVERAFAESEPPAHDDWKPANLPRGRAKTYVNVALRRLKEAASEMGLPGTGQTGGSGTGPPLGRLARRLGLALEGVVGEGGRRRRRRQGGGGRRPARARATPARFERLESTKSGCVAVFSTEVRQGVHRDGLSLSARAGVAIEGSRVLRTDGDIPQPTVVSIRSEDGGLAADSGNLELAGSEGPFEIRVLVPGDCAVTVGIEVLTGV